MTTQTTDNLDALTEEVKQLAKRAKQAAHALAIVDAKTKNKALQKLADAIRAAGSEIKKENALDLEAGKSKGLSKALIDRLTLNDDRIEGMAVGLEDMAKLDDPIGELIREWTRPNGIKINQVRVPLGVVGMIYESRPNVTAEAAGLCLKSGNAVILRGGSEAYHSNKILVDLIAKALEGSGIPQTAVQLLPPQDRRSTTVLTNLTGYVDLIVARGSEQMIKAVTSNATVPVMGHGKGLCHVYIDKAADVPKAVDIAFNSKVQRPGVCNAMETLLVHEHLMWDVLPKLTERYAQAGVKILGDERARGLINRAEKASDEDWDKEYLDKIISIKVVDSVDEAIDHIHEHGSGHTESIVTEDNEVAKTFLQSVDSSCVMVNASTRLHDGGVFGFGSEIGISTNKLHARGTMGLRELTSTKYLVEGTGQIRE